MLVTGLWRVPSMLVPRLINILISNHNLLLTYLWFYLSRLVSMSCAGQVCCLQAIYSCPLLHGERSGREMIASTAVVIATQASCFNLYCTLY
jgi:hypothetical protein